LWRILPRLSAVAELQWSAPASRDYSSFLLRVKRMQELYTAHGWAWNPAAE
jgi:N-acetyl-beta-hexosaminidase